MRRIWATCLLFAVFAMLTMAARHNHLEGQTSGHADACVHCTGAIATAPALPVAGPPPQLVIERPWVLPTTPPKPFLLRLDHSGCAPPLS